MATLETIRTKAGVFITIVIGLALVSFIVNPDTFTMGMNMFSSKNDVGKIAGNRIKYEDFDGKVNQVTRFYQIATNGAPINEQMNEQIRAEAWESFVQQYVFKGEFDKLGLGVSDSELTEVMAGKNPIDMVRRSFSNPQTGEFERSALDQFIKNMDLDPNAKYYWLYLEDQVRNQQLMKKYFGLSSKSVFVNKLEVKRAIEAASHDATFSFVAKNYDAIPDSTIKVSKSDLTKYYDKYKNQYQQARARDIEYVSFAVEPQSIDFERVVKEMTEIEKEMATTDIDKLGSFVSLNSEDSFKDIFQKKEDLNSEVDSFAFDAGIGAMKPMYQIGNTFSISRIIDRKTLPDSVKVEHIALGKENLAKADSIEKVIKGGGDFAALAKQYSLDQSTEGGDLGWISYKQMGNPIIDSCFLNPKGKLMKIESQSGLHLVRVTEVTLASPKVKLATVNMTVTPGRETVSDFFNKANNIAIKSNKKAEDFHKALTEEGIQARKEYNLQMGVRQIGGFNDVRELVRWVYNAKVGEVSEVLDVDNKSVFVVACLNKIKPAGIAPFDQVKNDIEMKVRKEKKAEKITEEWSENLKKAQTIDDFAQASGLKVQQSYNPINFTSSYISAIMIPEPKLIGAISASPENKLMNPVAGENGVYTYVVTTRTERDMNSDTEKMKMETIKETQLNGVLYSALMKFAEIEDNRGRFF